MQIAVSENKKTATITFFEGKEELDDNCLDIAAILGADIAVRKAETLIVKYFPNSILVFQLLSLMLCNFQFRSLHFVAALVGRSCLRVDNMALNSLAILIAERAQSVSHPNVVCLKFFDQMPFANGVADKLTALCKSNDVSLFVDNNCLHKNNDTKVESALKKRGVLSPMSEVSMTVFTSETNNRENTDPNSAASPATFGKRTD